VQQRGEKKDKLEAHILEEGKEIMPQVGNKKYPYTKAGKAAAAKAAKKKGKPPVRRASAPARGRPMSRRSY
tara:strand:- start:2550 stop:2762 length:213 start_codon:yes stop_codon:yes gene_type:complete